MDNSKIAMLRNAGWTDDEIAAFTKELGEAVHRREIPDDLAVRVADIVAGRIYEKKEPCAFAAAHGVVK